MLGVSFNFPRSGTVAFFATLFVAICVNEAKECSFSNDVSSTFEYTCNGLENAWKEKTVDKLAADSKEKTALTLKPDHNGCLKTVQMVPLNSSSAVTFRLFRSADDDDSRSMTLRIVPKDRSCSNEECEWNFESSAAEKDQWKVFEHRFPVKSTQDYHIQLEVNKGKGELIFDRFTVSGLPEEYKKCSEVAPTKLQASEETLGDGDIVPNKYIKPAEGDTPANTSFAPGLAEFSKNLMLTSASVLTLNNLLN